MATSPSFSGPLSLGFNFHSVFIVVVFCLFCFLKWYCPLPLSESKTLRGDEIGGNSSHWDKALVKYCYPGD